MNDKEMKRAMTVIFGAITLCSLVIVVTGTVWIVKALVDSMQ